MAEVFISYKRDAKPDDHLAEFIDTDLARRGHQVFIDKRIEIGQHWPTVLKERLEQATALVVLLSSASVRSEMVIKEVEMMHARKSEHDKPVILPVRVAYDGPSPYHLAAIIDSLQHASWQKDGDERGICERLHASIEESKPPPPTNGIEGESGPTATEGTNEAPLPSTDPRFLEQLETPGGAVRLSSPFYIERRADRELSNLILSMGETALIKGPRQVGKSSVLARLYQHAREQDLNAVYLDFQRLDDAALQDINSLLLHIGNLISVRFRTAKSPDHYWDERFGAKDNLTTFLGEEVLDKIDKPFVFFMDEVDRLFASSFRDDFFGLIRSWHNDRAFDEERFGKFNMVLAYSTEAYLFIRNLNESPFNVGVKCELEDFGQTEVERLNELHGQPIRTPAQMDELHGLLSGHPFLVRRTYYDIVQKRWTPDALIARACDDDGPFADHLHGHLLALESRPELREELKSAINQKTCSSDLVFCQLRSGGFVKGPNRSAVEPRCGLYERYFGDRL